MKALPMWRPPVGYDFRLWLQAWLLIGCLVFGVFIPNLKYKKELAPQNNKCERDWNGQMELNNLQALCYQINLLMPKGAIKLKFYPCRADSDSSLDLSAGVFCLL